MLPEPLPGKTFVLFRPARSRSWHASIVMGTHKEDFLTSKSDKTAAGFAAAKRIYALYKKLGIESPAEKRRKKGELSEYQIERRKKLGLPLKVTNGVGKPRLGRPPGSKARRKNGHNDMFSALPPASEPFDLNSTYDGPLTKIERDYARGFLKILEMMMVGLINQPVLFADSCRVIMIKAIQGKRGLI